MWAHDLRLRESQKMMSRNQMGIVQFPKHLSHLSRRHLIIGHTRQVDTWFAVDRLTGRRQGSVSFNGCEAAGTPWESPDSNRQCPNLQHPNFLIGRTEYNIMMFDSRSAGGRKWNISFYDYSSNMGSGGVGADYGEWVLDLPRETREARLEPNTSY